MKATPQHFCPYNTKQVLILEQDVALAKRLVTTIAGRAKVSLVVAPTSDNALTLLDKNIDTTLAAVVNLQTADVQNVLKTLIPKGVPLVVYNQDDDSLTQGVTESLVGEQDALPEMAGVAIAKIAANYEKTILIVDDSRSMRMALSRFLSVQGYRLVEAEDGQEALDRLAEHPGIRLVITDNEMPNMDGITLVKEIRKQFSKDDLAVIGISAKTSPVLSVQFINNGANDFLHKPFQKEELYCRVEHNLEMLNRIDIIRELSNRDFLTHLFNRRYFFENAEAFIKRIIDEGGRCCMGMIDIDYFKRVNDTYGHDVGDEVLKSVSDCILYHFPGKAIASRFGGEEFCVLSGANSLADMMIRFEGLRKTVEVATTTVKDERVKVTISIGLCCETEPLSTMLKLADSRLYTAKETGRNRVVGPPPSSTVRGDYR